MQKYVGSGRRSYGPTLEFSRNIHATKYRKPGETFEDSVSRVAGPLADDAKHKRALTELLLDMRFLPAGRVQSAIGSGGNITAYNCFVSGTIEDSFVDGYGAIMHRAIEAAATMRAGGGIGYDFSTLRPRGALIKKLRSNSTGPVSFMRIFDAICRCVASSGHRRGAQMGVLRVDHPDIEEFISAKQNSHDLTGFNISVAITDYFMECVAAGKPFPLQFNGEIYRHVDAAELMDKIMRATWDYAEPGVLFIDTINRENNLWYCETIAATNPCGEQPLPPHGACLLGSMNLVKYVKGKTIDTQRLARDAVTAYRAMDNVIDCTTYPLHAQQHEAYSKRRMGMGVTGMANAIEATGAAYGSGHFVAWQREILNTISDALYEASVERAKSHGHFEMFDGKKYGSQGYVAKHVPSCIRKDIKRYGIRNSHLLSIAPTGTISSAADNVSSGIEPVFSYEYNRKVNMPDGVRTETITDYGFREFGVRGKTASELSVAEHMRVLATAARWVDSAVSKTINVGSDVTLDEFKDIYIKAYGHGIKGVATFRLDGKRAGVLTATENKENAACTYDPATGKRSCD